MEKNIIKALKILLILSSILLHHDSFASKNNEILTTDHFLIKYNSTNISCAVALAAVIEKCHAKIGSFLEFDPLDRININLYNEKTGFSAVESGNNLYISSDSNFSTIENELYKKIFKIYLQKKNQKRIPVSFIDEYFLEALIQYPLMERRFIELMRDDLVNNSKLTSVDVRNINNYTRDERLTIYKIYIDFIISNYGKKYLIQSLLDAEYYNGIYESLSSITGDDFFVISDKFNSYINKQVNVAIGDQGNGIKLLHSIDEFNDISYSVSQNDQYAVLQEYNNKFRLLLGTGGIQTYVNLEKSSSGSLYNDLVFLDSNLIAINEVLENGSKIHVFDIIKSRIINEFSFPYLFISKMNSSNETGIIFSAFCGMKSDIYTFNLSTGKFDILTNSGSNSSPVLIKNKIYYISNLNNYSIVEFDLISGGEKKLFSTDQQISVLSKGGENSVVFSMKFNGLEKIFIFDINRDSLHQVESGNFSNTAPQISDKNIYYFSYFKSRYRLFLKLYDTVNH